MKYQISFNIEFLKNRYPGKLIAVEGIDAAGKTTQVEEIVKHLNNTGQTIATKEPTDSFIGCLIRDVLRGKVELPNISFQYLFAADRQIHQEWILEQLKKGINVVSDRYFWSSVAYGMADKENINDRDLVTMSILSMYHQFIVPDRTFYLEISVKEASFRLSKMTKNRELYERKEKLEKIKKGYDWLVEKFPQEIIVINGEKPVEAVTEDILSNVMPNSFRHLKSKGSEILK